MDGRGLRINGSNLEAYRHQTSDLVQRVAACDGSRSRAAERRRAILAFVLVPA